VCRLNNSETFGGKPIGSVEFLIRMVEVLGITIIDRLPNGRLCKKEKSSTIEKIGCVSIF
jgi:hypothetical protein